MGGNTPWKHDANVRRVLGALQKHRLRVHPGKVRPKQKQIQFLRVTTVAGGFHLKDYAKELGADVPLINSKQKLQALLESPNYLKPFVHMYSRVVRPF